MYELLRRQFDRLSLPVLGRALWAGMIAAHAPALINAWRALVADGFDAEQVGGCLALTLATVFFVLKLAAWRRLRLPGDHRSLVAFGLVVALLHVDCFRPTADERDPAQWAIVATMGVLITGPERISKAVRALAARLELLGKKCLPNTDSHKTVWLDSFRPHCWVLLFRTSIPRSPPLA